MSGSTIATATVNSPSAVHVYSGLSGTPTQAADISEPQVASLAISGDTIVVGANVENAKMGEAFVLSDAGGSWTQTQTLTPSPAVTAGGPGDFGHSVGISGNTIAVGAPINTVGSTALQGTVFVYTQSSGGSFSQVSALTAAAGSPAWTGSSLAMSGGLIAAGADETTVGSNAAQGAVYMLGTGGQTVSGTVYGDECGTGGCSESGLANQTILVQGTASDGSTVATSAVSDTGNDGGAVGSWSVIVPPGAYVAGPTLDGTTIDGRGFDPEQSSIVVGSQNVGGIDFVTCAGTVDASADALDVVSPFAGAVSAPAAKPACEATYSFRASADIPQKEFVDPSPLAPYARNYDGTGYAANNQSYGEWDNKVPECEDFAHETSHPTALEWYSYYRGTPSLGTVTVNLGWNRYSDVVAGAGSALTKGRLTRVFVFLRKGKIGECEDTRPVWPEVWTSTQANSFEIVISWALPFTAPGVETPESTIKGLPGIGKKLHTLVDEAAAKVDGFEGLSYAEKQATVFLVAEGIEHSLLHFYSAFPSQHEVVELIQGTLHYEKSINLPALIAQVGWGIVAAQVEELAGYHPMVMVIRGQLTTGHCPSAVVLINNPSAYRLCDTTSLATDVTTDAFPDYHLALLRNGTEVSTVTALAKPQQVEVSSGPDAATLPNVTQSSETFPAYKIKSGNRDMNDLYKAMKAVGPSALQAEAGSAIYGPAGSALQAGAPACRNIDHFGTSYTRCYTWLDLSP